MSRVFLVSVVAVAATMALTGCDHQAQATDLQPTSIVTSGGDDGRIINVTSLSDSGPGSLREALSQKGSRKIAFKVGGEIWLKSPITLREPFVTIAGETAPSPGISLMGDSLRIRGHDVIVRHLRVRVGARPDNSPPENRDGIGVDGSVNGLNPAYNILIDHCSVAWSLDEGVAIYGRNTHDVVVRDTIVAEALLHSIHPKGPHSMGLLVGPQTYNVLVQRNILADNRWRNPAVSAGASAVVVNNLIYNPGAVGLHYYSRRNPDPTKVAAVGNVVVAGPDTKAELRQFQQGMSAGSALYYLDNVARGTRAFDTGESAGLLQRSPFRTTPPVWRADLKPLPSSAVVAALLRSSGARPWDRDAVDARIISEIAHGQGHITDAPSDPRLRAPEGSGSGPMVKQRWLNRDARARQDPDVGEE